MCNRNKNETKERSKSFVLTPNLFKMTRQVTNRQINMRPSRSVLSIGDRGQKALAPFDQVDVEKSQEKCECAILDESCA
jgi:hypothetical protein